MCSHFASYQPNVKILANEFIPQLCLEEQHDIWISCNSNKLHAIYPNVDRIPHCESVTLTLHMYTVSQKKTSDYIC